MVIPPGTKFGDWEVIREVERSKNNRRLECRCTGCGTIAIKWHANLIQGKYGCLTCVPWRDITDRGRKTRRANYYALAQMTEEGRLCFTCGTWKPWSEFDDDRRRGPERKQSTCKECSRWRSKQSTYGITRQEWEWLYAKQKGRCSLCKEVDTRCLSIDHDHSCCGSARACKKCIRGLLCSNCNRMLGFVDGKAALRRRFADYLDRRPFASLTAGDALPVLEDVRPPGEDDWPKGLTDALF
jgi:hypothetical protein